MSVTNFKKNFIFRLEFIVLILVLFILLGLGFWQLHRYQEKRMILQAVAKQSNAIVVEWNMTKPAPQNFLKLSVSGQLLKQVFYLDNQFYQHQLGYHILVPIELDNHTILLLDQGWISLGNNRTALPEITSDSSTIWSGTVYYPQLSKVDLGQFLDRKDGLKYVVETLNTKEISKILGKKVLPWVLRNNSTDVSPYIRKWDVVTVSPQRHVAYASQWFMMAFVVLTILIWRIVKR